MAAVLAHRRQRFFSALDGASIDEIFAQLASWSESEGARGCLFLRALSDAGTSIDEVAAEVTVYRKELHLLITRLVRSETGDGNAVEAMLVLFEGAVAAASYRGVGAIHVARTAAAVLLNESSER
ncbi:hypothetical protein [Denitrobaculum tricleocarpae]|nr:hypothetical protein [Denitrobaculum tricleocarpae]